MLQCNICKNRPERNTIKLESIVHLEHKIQIDEKNLSKKAAQKQYRYIKTNKSKYTIEVEGE